LALSPRIFEGFPTDRGASKNKIYVKLKKDLYKEIRLPSGFPVNFYIEHGQGAPFTFQYKLHKFCFYFIKFFSGWYFHSILAEG
jgi:hypothetical protein